MLPPVMRLITLHRILIATMVAFLGYFAWYQVKRWQASGSGAALAITVACVAVGLALTWYITNLKRYVQFEPPATEERPEDSAPPESRG